MKNWSIENRVFELRDQSILAGRNLFILQVRRHVVAKQRRIGHCCNTEKSHKVVDESLLLTTSGTEDNFVWVSPVLYPSLINFVDQSPAIDVSCGMSSMFRY